MSDRSHRLHLSRTSSPPRSVLAPPLLGAALACALGLSAPASQALGLGGSELKSALGQPLDVRVALSANATEDIGCVVVKGRDDLPVPSGLRVQTGSDPHGAYVEITSAQRVTDPAIVLIVQAGCAAPISREYVLFLDPAPLNPPASVVANPAVIAANPPTPDTAATVPGEPVTRRARQSGANVLGQARHTEPVAPSTAGAGRSLQKAPGAPLARPERGSDQARQPGRDQRPAAPAPRLSAPPAAVTAPGSSAISAPASPGAPTPGQGDRLHLSRAIDSPDLRVATELLPNAGPPPDAVRLAELKVLQARLMALLNDQNPDSVVSARETDLQNRIKTLSGDVGTLRQQVQQAQERSLALEQSRGPASLPWILGALALAALATAAWFFMRYRSAQENHGDHPWWEQSQLAAVAASSEARLRGAVGARALDDDENTVSGPATAGRSTQPAGTRRPATVRPPAAGVAPITTARIPGRASAPPPAAAAIPPVIPAAKPASAPAAPIPAAASAPPAVPAAPPAVPRIPADRPAQRGPSGLPFGAISSSVGSLDERVDTTELTRSAIDFNLDLPEILNPTPARNAQPPAPSASGAAMPMGPAPAPGAASPAAQAAFKLQPLDFELPSKVAPAPAETASMGPDTILRLDDQNAPGPASVATGHSGEHASLQFRLLQFAAVIEQATELRNAGEPAKSIAVLRQYVLRDENIPTLMWLMLFELYRQVNKRPVYEALADHFSRRYKRPMVRWDETLDQKTPQVGLAEVPEVERQLKARWGTEAGLELLRGLICDRDRADAIVFNAVLQRDLLLQAKVFPLEDSE